MDLWDYREFREPERFSEEEETLLSALEQKDEVEAWTLTRQGRAISLAFS